MKERVLSGMRPTGALHLGHYHGALKNWIRLQSEMECFYFVADWHALTTHYDDPRVIEQSVYEMVIDWLAAGLDPNQCVSAPRIFVSAEGPDLWVDPDVVEDVRAGLRAKGDNVREEMMTTSAMHLVTFGAAPQRGVFAAGDPRKSSFALVQ